MTALLFFACFAAGVFFPLLAAGLGPSRRDPMEETNKKLDALQRETRLSRYGR